MICSAASTPGPTPARGDFRSELDFLVITNAIERYQQIERQLLILTEQVADLEKTKNKEEKARILREITENESFLDGSKGYYERELKRTDLDLIEKYNFDAALATISLLDKDLKTLSTRVSSIKV